MESGRFLREESMRAPERAQRVRKDAAAEEHFSFERSVDSRAHRERLTIGRDRDRSRQRAFVGERREARDREDLVSGQAEGGDSRPVEEFERHHAHAHQIRPVDPFEAFCEDGPDPQELRTLRRPVA